MFTCLWNSFKHDKLSFFCSCVHQLFPWKFTSMADIKARTTNFDVCSAGVPNINKRVVVNFSYIFIFTCRFVHAMNFFLWRITWPKKYRMFRFSYTVFVLPRNCPDEDTDVPKIILSKGGTNALKDLLKTFFRHQTSSEKLICKFLHF